MQANIYSICLHRYLSQLQSLHAVSVCVCVFLSFFFFSFGVDAGAFALLLTWYR